MIAYPTTAKTTNGAFPEPAGKLVDDWLRRELRVGDPRDPSEVSKALLGRYKPEAIKLEEESRGLSVPLGGPIWQIADAQSAAKRSPASCRIDEVLKDLDADTSRLLSTAAVREWVPEMEGWKQTLLREASDGADAARYAQDAGSRDRAFLAVRRLSDYARVARLIGTRNGEAMFDFRRLATTLDSAGFAIRILMGEALYDAGLMGGGFIIQVPLTDMRQRRESVMLALRRLVGANDADQGFGNGPHSYGALLGRVEAKGETDLRVYLRETQMAQVLDDLLGSAARQDPVALRRLSATAPVEIGRLSLLLRIASQMQPPSSSALSAFVQTLRLFLEAFQRTRSGSRLIAISVPLPMAAWQMNEGDAPGVALLRNVVTWRSDFAREVECFQNCCSCDDNTRKKQQRLDFALSLVDRAIDLIAQGQGLPPNWSGNEVQAAALLVTVSNLQKDATPAVVDLVQQKLLQTGALAPIPPSTPTHKKLRAHWLHFVWQREIRDQHAWRALVTQLAPRCAKFD